jgi:DNA-directed RNA polymerase subunit RPC12/RpoP
MLYRLIVKCNNCAQTTQRGDFEAHKLGCPIACPHECGESTTRSTLSTHESICTHMIVSCPLSVAGCPAKIPAANLGEHKKICQWHLTLPIIAPLIETLTEEQKSLEKKISTMKIKEQNQMKEINHLRLEVKTLTGTVSDLEKQQGTNDNMVILFKSLCTEMQLLRQSNEIVASLKRDKWNYMERICKRCGLKFYLHSGGICSHKVIQTYKQENIPCPDCGSKVKSMRELSVQDVTSIQDA